MKRLTQRQHDVLVCVIEEIADTGKAPTIEEIRVSLGMSHVTQVARAVDSLVAKKYLERRRYLHRGLKVLRGPDLQVGSATLGLVRIHG